MQSFFKWKNGNIAELFFPGFLFAEIEVYPSAFSLGKETGKVEILECELWVITVLKRFFKWLQVLLASQQKITAEDLDNSDISMCFWPGKENREGWDTIMCIVKDHGIRDFKNDFSFYYQTNTKKIVAENLDNSEKWIIWIIQNLDNCCTQMRRHMTCVLIFQILCENISILIYFHTWNKLNLSIMFSNLCLNLMHCEHLNYIFFTSSWL